MFCPDKNLLNLLSLSNGSQLNLYLPLRDQRCVNVYSAARKQPRLRHSLAPMALFTVQTCWHRDRAETCAGGASGGKPSWVERSCRLLRGLGREKYSDHRGGDLKLIPVNKDFKTTFTRFWRNVWRRHLSQKLTMALTTQLVEVSPFIWSHLLWDLFDIFSRLKTIIFEKPHIALIILLTE